MEDNNVEEVKPVETPIVPETPAPEPPKKGKGSLGIILIIIAMIVIGGGVFLAYNDGIFNKKDKNNNNEVKNDNDNSEKEPEKKKFEEETLTKDSEIVQKLYKAFSEPETYAQNKETTEAYKKRVTLNLLEESDRTIKTCGELDNIYEDGWYCAYDFEQDDYDTPIEKIREHIKDEKVGTISVDLFHEKYNTIFEGTFEDKSESLGECMRFLYYDKVNNLYATSFMIPFAGCVISGYENVLKGIVQENGMLTIQTGLTIDTEPEKLIDYTFKFDSNTGNYIFVSRTIN